MILARRIAAALALLALATPVVAAAPAVKTPEMKTVSYEAWHFSTRVPRAAQKLELPREGEVELYEVFKSGGFVYMVKVTSTPADTLSSTAIEQTMQALAASSKFLGTAERWEHERNGEPWKGISRSIRANGDTPHIADVVEKAVGSRIAAQSMCMAPLGDGSSSVLTIGVIGPQSAAADVAAMAKYVAGLTVIGSVKQTAPAPSTLPKPGTEPGIKPPGKVVPKPVKPAAKKWPQLKKGDIELAGVVKSVDVAAKSMILTADTVTMPGAKPIKLDPAREKAVSFKSLPEGVEAGARIRIMGANTGVGLPMTAAHVEKTGSE